MAFTVAELAQWTGGVVDGDGSVILTGAASLEEAGPGDLAFAANAKALTAALRSEAGCILLPSAFNGKIPRASIRVDNPRLAFAQALEKLYPRKPSSGRIHPSAVIALSAEIGPGCEIGPNVTIGERSRLGADCRIGPGCAIGDDVEVGERSTLHAHVSIYDRVKIGARAMLHAGCVIGADGFGFALAGDRYEKFPQVGTVEIGGDVEIGANCCIDRAALGVTRIGEGTKLDNLVHVAHNCRIGKHVVVAAQTGFSGSVTVGDYAVIGGQAGIGEKAKIAGRAIIGGKAGVLTSQTVEAGEPVWGIPARPLRGHLKSLAYIQKLPELNRTVGELRQRLNELDASKTGEV